MPSKRVLIVEDDAAFIPLIKIALRDLDYDIQTASDGRTALTTVETESFDLVITDYRLPDIDGVQIIRASREQNEKCKAILISAANEDMVDAPLDDLDLLSFIQKPLSPLYLRHLVVTAFAEPQY